MKFLIIELSNRYSCANMEAVWFSRRGERREGRGQKSREKGMILVCSAKVGCQINWSTVKRIDERVEKMRKGKSVDKVSREKMGCATSWKFAFKAKSPFTGGLKLKFKKATSVFRCRKFLYMSKGMNVESRSTNRRTWSSRDSEWIFEPPRKKRRPKRFLLENNSSNN